MRAKKQEFEYLAELRRLEFIAYTKKINESKEAMSLLEELSVLAGEPFKTKVIYVTLRPCGSCVEVFKVLGVGQVYYGSEHPDNKFVNASATAANGQGSNKMKITLAYFANEGAIEPNSLFFALCKKPGCESLSANINMWFADFINDLEPETPISLIKKKQEIFQAFISKLLQGIYKDTDLEMLNTSLLLDKQALNLSEILRQLHI